MVSIARSLRSAIVCLLVAGATAGLHAQAGDIGKGRLNVGFEKSFAEQIRQLGIDIKYHGYRDETRHMGFSTIAGSLDLATGQGEVHCKGGVHFTAGSMELDMDELALELDASEIVVTALIKENGTLMGRHRIYDVIGRIPVLTCPWLTARSIAAPCTSLWTRSSGNASANSFRFPKPLLGRPVESCT